MVENSPIRKPTSPLPSTPVEGPSKAGSTPASSEQGGPAFRALLESLQEKARSLQHDSQHVDKPEDLSEAVDRARASLDDALSLGDRLLEAYREAVQQDNPPESGADSSGQSA